MKTIAAIVIALAAAGCGTAGDDVGDGTGSCEISGSVGSGGAPLGGALAIGTGYGAEFVAVADGSSLELVMGNQGGWMVTPVLRIDDDAVTADGPCPHAEINVAVGDGGPGFADTLSPPFERGDGYWYSIELPLFLSLDVDELVGQSAAIEVSVDNGEISAEIAVDRLVLRNDE